MRRFPNPLVAVLLVASVAVAAGSATATTYTIEVQSGGAGTVTPSGMVEVPAGGSQTFTFEPSGCQGVGEVTVDDVPVGTGLAEYTFTDVQGDHVLYVPFNAAPATTTALAMRPEVGSCGEPDTLTATVTGAGGGQVEFHAGSMLLGTSTLVAGVATLVVKPGLTAGSYVLTANYLGASCAAASTSPDTPYEVADAQSSSLALEIYGSHAMDVSWPADFRTTLSPVATQGVVITYYDGDVPVGTVTTTSGFVYQFRWYPRTTGDHVITAVARLSFCAFEVPSNPVTVHVTGTIPTPTSLALTVTPAQVNPGGSVVMDAEVEPWPATGVIHFLDVTAGIEVATVKLVAGLTGPIAGASINYGPLTSSRTLQARFDGDQYWVGSTSNQGSVVVAGPVATLVAQFEATASVEGNEVRWSFGDASRVAGVIVERASDVAGPWLAIAPERREESGTTVAHDRTATAGAQYFYRLVVLLTDGSRQVTGPVSVGEAAPVISELTLLSPNPTSHTSQVECAIARAGRVRVEVADVSGRAVATLFDGVPREGRFQVAWDGTNRGERLPAGLYFVRLTAPDRTMTRKITRLP